MAAEPARQALPWRRGRRLQFERELAFLEGSLLDFLAGPFVLDTPSAYLHRVDVLLLEAAFASSDALRTKHYRGAAVAAALGALAATRASRPATPMLEASLLIERLDRIGTCDPHERLSALREQLRSEETVALGERLIEIAAGAAAVGARR